MMTNWTPDLSRHRGPRYLAIAAALADDISSGRLAIGERVPTHRELAYQLGLTVGTVTRAYAEATARGLIDGEIGRGTFVRERPSKGFGDVPSEPARPDGIDFGLNYPPMGSEETEAFRSIFREVADMKDIEPLLGYTPHGGLERHRRAIAHWFQGQGVPADPALTIVTSGAQNGMMLAFSATIEPGEVVLVDKFTFPGMISLAEMLKLRLVAVDMDEDGVVPEALEMACRQHGPRAYYAVPTIHNPTCATIPLERRREIARIAQKEDLLIVEDDIYRFLDPSAPPPLVALAPDNVIFLSSASKQLAPGLRIGGLITPERFKDRIEAVIRTSTWMPSPPMGEVLTRWIEDGTTKRLEERKRRVMRERQAILKRVLGEHEIVSHPHGMHAWLRMPDGREAREVAHEAAASGVSVSPGLLFASNRGPGRRHIRICIGNPPTNEAVTRGLEILGDILADRPSQFHASVL
jgi:DNA-binding transcriptional MocR family regulator